MLVDGKKIASRILNEVKNTVSHMEVAPHVTIFTCAPNLATQKYLELKKRKASEVDIQVNVVEFEKNVSTEDIIQSIKTAAMQTNGIVVQLPLPSHIDTNEVLRAVPVACDIDGIHFDGTAATVLPPVTAAIDEISTENDVLWAATNVVVIGSGRLVGYPTSLWARTKGAQVEVITKGTPLDEISKLVSTADILVLGAGQPNMIKPEMIKPGVVIFDAGTSEDGGELVGDADQSCTAHASIMTPVPGGIGPVTIACLLRNLVHLTKC